MHAPFLKRLAVFAVLLALSKCSVNRTDTPANTGTYEENQEENQEDMVIDSVDSGDYEEDSVEYGSGLSLSASDWHDLATTLNEYGDPQICESFSNIAEEIQAVSSTLLAPSSLKFIRDALTVSGINVKVLCNAFEGANLLEAIFMNEESCQNKLVKEITAAMLRDEQLRKVFWSEFSDFKSFLPIETLVAFTVEMDLSPCLETLQDAHEVVSNLVQPLANTFVADEELKRKVAHIGEAFLSKLSATVRGTQHTKTLGQYFKYVGTALNYYGETCQEASDAWVRLCKSFNSKSPEANADLISKFASTHRKHILGDVYCSVISHYRSLVTLSHCPSSANLLIDFVKYRPTAVNRLELVEDLLQTALSNKGPVVAQCLKVVAGILSRYRFPDEQRLLRGEWVILLARIATTYHELHKVPKYIIEALHALTEPRNINEEQLSKAIRIFVKGPSYFTAADGMAWLDILEELRWVKFPQVALASLKHTIKPFIGLQSRKFTCFSERVKGFLKYLELRRN